MKILLGCDTYPTDVNGAARFAERLSIGLVGRGHEVHVAAPSTTGPVGVEERDGVVVHRIRSLRYPLHEEFRISPPWSTKPEVASLVRALRPDVVHAQAHFIVGRYVCRSAHEQGIPLVATNHFMPENLTDQLPIPVPGVLGRLASRLAWRDLRRVFGDAQVVTAPTPRATELLAASAGIPDALPISCGIDAAPYAKAALNATPSSVPTILFVGRLDQEKRVGELIDAVAALPDSLPVQLEIVGDGTMREQWKAQVQQRGISDRTVFRGFISEEELLAAYGRCDVFCMPGIAELQSLVTLEAMAAGKPVVAADAMALPHLVHPGRNGWLYTPGDIGELTLRLSTLLSDAELRHRMGLASQEIVRSHDLEATLDRFEGLYREAITAAPANRRHAA
ncbi:glycosyltransferase [Gephyromycinifex aptenodytis]|uniref:glycosyltransferase n=1 Tax=Gephyromycinifex aptenodytis TaxID=2716227 RepID=UPI0014454A47|nr:glycosyltransferase [Gephyromycinifex aptenodytis]